MLDPDALMALRLGPTTCEWTRLQSMLYSMGVGVAAQSVDERTLPFVYEKDQRALPSFATIFGMSAMPRAAQMGLDPVSMIHAEQEMTLHAPIPPEGKGVVSGWVDSIYDRGDRGAVITSISELTDSATGKVLASFKGTTVAKDGGGFGGNPPPPRQPGMEASRAPDLTVDVPTRIDQALLYRLSGDMNPLHADPAEARRVGFDDVILHGLCTYGIACNAVLKHFADHDPARMASHAMRFAAPVYPGDILTFDFWRDGARIDFRIRVAARDIIVVKDGRSTLND